MIEESVTLYRGVPMQDLSALLRSAHVPNPTVERAMRQRSGFFRHQGFFYTTSMKGPAETAYTDVNREGGIPVILKLEINRQNFLLMNERLEKIRNTDLPEFEFDLVSSFDELKQLTTCTVNLGGLSENELNDLGLSVAIGDPKKDLEHAFPEFKPYDEVKREIQAREGNIPPEEPIPRI